MYHTYTSGRKNPYNQAYGGYGTWTHEQGININYYYGDAGTNSQPYTSRNSSTTSRSVWNMMCTTRDTSTVKWYKNDTLINSASKGMIIASRLFVRYAPPNKAIAATGVKFGMCGNSLLIATTNIAVRIKIKRGVKTFVFIVILYL